MKTTNLILFMLAMLFVVSCSDDDGQVPIMSPTVTYSETNYMATFFEPGSSLAPTINWNGSQGSFSLAPTIPGLNINSTTGVISWSNVLPAGLNETSVIASNSGGQVSIPITIENPLDGNFEGTASGAAICYRIFADGTMDANDGNCDGTPTVTGTWTLTGNELLANYQTSSGFQLSIKCTLQHSASSVKLVGKWYVGSDADPANERGDVDIERQ